LAAGGHVIALHVGHRDGGKLVRTTYGHRDERIARERVREAFRQAPPAAVPLVAVDFSRVASLGGLRSPSQVTSGQTGSQPVSMTVWSA
jgi:hypothetical protein